MISLRPTLINGLHWLRPELEASLSRARAQLERYLDAPEDRAPLAAVSAELQVVRGVLVMIRCLGAARLAAEMLSLLAMLRADDGGSLLDARLAEGFTALSGATLQLSDYLELLAAGEPDRAVLLQPVINELRAARGQALLTEAELFAGQMDAEAATVPLPPAPAVSDLPAARDYARRELGGFQQAFLQWFRGVSAKDPLARIARVSEGLAARVADPAARLGWTAYAALAEALRGSGSSDSLDLKRLIGRAGTLLKLLVDQDEATAAAQTGDTPWQVLWQLAHQPRLPPSAEALLRAAGVDERLPDRRRLDQLARRLRAPGSGILDRVYMEIREDFARIKDSIDLAVRAGGRVRGEGSGAVERLRRLAKTLATLGLPAPQMALTHQIRTLEGGPPDALTWMEVATAILRVEHSLEEALFRTLGRHGDETQRPYAEIETEVPHAQDLRNAMRAMFGEALLNLAQLRAAVEAYLADGEASRLLPVPAWLHEIAAALQVIGRPAAAVPLHTLAAQVRSCLERHCPREQFPAQAFAEAEACAELLLEALRDQLPQPERFEQDLVSAVSALSGGAADRPASAAPAPEPVADPPAADPELQSVFVDEAQEVLEHLRRGLPALERDPGNPDVLTTVRRGFHTLKGSGRMVGATRIAEFAWTLERLLNRCLDGTRVADAGVVERVREAVALLPGLIAGFRQPHAEDSGVARLIARIEQPDETPAEPDLQTVFRDDARDRLEAVQRWLEAQPPDGDAVIDEAPVIAFHTLRGAAAVVNAVALGRLAAAAEQTLEDRRRAGLGLQPDGLALYADVVRIARQWVDRLHAGASIEESAGDPWIDRLQALLAPAAGEHASAGPRPAPVDDSFAMTALDLLQRLEAEARAWAQRPGESVAARLRGGLMELAARAADAGSEALASFAQQFAARLTPWVAQAAAVPDAAMISALQDAFEQGYQLLDAYRDGRPDATQAEPATTACLARIPEPPAPPRAEIDPELLDIFVGEADELAEGLNRQFPAWRNSGDPAVAGELRRLLHTLKGSARMAGVEGIGTLAHRIESLLDDEAGTAGQQATRVGLGIDGLLRQIDALHRGEFLPAAPVLAAIDAAASVGPASPPTADNWLDQAIDLAGPETRAPEIASPPPAADEELPSLDRAGGPADTVEAPDSGAASGVPGVPEAETASLDLHDFDSGGPGEPASPPSVPHDAPSAETLPALDPGAFDPEPAGPESVPAAIAGPAEPVAVQPPVPAGASPETSTETELQDTYLGEAAALLVVIERGFQSWRAGNAGGPVLELLRALHTLKGGARTAHLEPIADRAHGLETRINGLLAHGETPDATVFAELDAELGALLRAHETLGVVLREPVPAAAPVPLAVPSRQWAGELFWRPETPREAGLAARREMARVPVETLDRLVAEAGEIAVGRARLEENVGSLRAQLGEVTQTLARVRDQLRMMDIETDAQIAARGLQGARPDGYAQDFDPLELDRYSRMQELSRALAESVNDLAALQSTMNDAVGAAEALLQQQGRVAGEVQQGLLGTLMVPFSRQAPRLLRLVRQTAQENGRLAELRLAGIEAEVDRNVLERMTAPLEHLLRNAVVHGIEPPAVRRAAGKPETGSLRIELQRDGAQLVVEVADDGAGLDLVAIRRKAVELGLMLPEAQLADEALARFIFEPGFSTAAQLTQDAGRGIGMDVVGAEVKQLGGSIELASEHGSGTRFRIRLPLTVAVSRALMVGVGGETYALPLQNVEGIVRIPVTELAGHLGQAGAPFIYGGQVWPVRHLGDFVELPAELPDKVRSVTAVLVRLGSGFGGEAGERLALVVERLIGNREIVSKTVGAQLGSVPGIAGATVLADGRVVLILDVPALVLRAARRAAAPDAVAPPPRETRDSIMVVDDSITMRRVAERILTRAGFRVVLARDGLDAIAQLHTERPAVVLLDIEMPRADGFEVATFIRNSADLGRTPIIMITSRSGDKHRARASVIGVDRYLTKPYQEDQLLADIESLRRSPA